MSLTFDAVSKSYGSRLVLNAFSESFATGRVAAIVGPNGAGKTTLLRIAAGLQRPDSGAVRAGRVLYYGGFDTLPVKGTVDRLRRAAGLWPSQDARKLSKLSRGELQLVGLQIAFDLKSEVLLLDEPWTALEPDARETLNERIRLAAGGRTIVCSSHDLDEVARIADDVVFLRDGASTRVSRESHGASFERDELIRLYRQSKCS